MDNAWLLYQTVPWYLLCISSMCVQATTLQPWSEALQLLEHFAGYVKTRKDDAAQLCSTVATQAPDENYVVIDGEAHPPGMFMTCYHYSRDTQFLLVDMLRNMFHCCYEVCHICCKLCCSVCYTADDEGGDARTGLHRVSNAIAGALLFACFVVQHLYLLNVLSCLW